MNLPVNIAIPLGADTAQAQPISGECDHPSVVLRDLASRRRPNGHVIVFANEKGGVGKSTLAFHCCIALSNAGHKVVAIDLDRRQHSLSSALIHRDATARNLGVDLPRPRHALLERQSGALLSQEIARLGSNCDFVVIDVAGHDSNIARRAIAMADTLVTPVNSSFVDVSGLGKVDPVTMQPGEAGKFGALVRGLINEREKWRLPPVDWVVMKNRTRAVEINHRYRVDRALLELSQQLGFRLSAGLGERVAYRELFLFGLTHLDLKLIPGLAKLHARSEEEICRLIAGLNLPDRREAIITAERRQTGKVIAHSAEAFRNSLIAHLQAAPKALATAD